MIDTAIQKLSTEFKQGLVELYGSRFDKLVLFGSYARGDFKEDSDVDFMLILNDETVSGGNEVGALSPFVGHLSMKYNKFVSILPTNKYRFLQSQLPFYKEVRKDAIEI